MDSEFGWLGSRVVSVLDSGDLKIGHTIDVLQKNSRFKFKFNGTMGVNSLPKTVTRQRRGCDYVNPGPTAPESSTLTTRLPSHPTDEGPLNRCACVCLVVGTCRVKEDTARITAVGWRRARLLLLLKRGWMRDRHHTGMMKMSRAAAAAAAAAVASWWWTGRYCD